MMEEDGQLMALKLIRNLLRSQSSGQKVTVDSRGKSAQHNVTPAISVPVFSSPCLALLFSFHWEKTL